MNEWVTCDNSEFCNNSTMVWDYIWEDSEVINNLIIQLDMQCVSSITIGLFGSCFLVGIVLGSLTVTRVGDIKGRRQGFMLGLVI